MHNDQEPQKLTESSDYKAILDSALDLIVVHDAKTGQPLDVNKATLYMYGWTKEEFLKLQVEDWSSGVTPYTQKEAQESMMKAAHGETQRFDWHSKKRDGKLFWVEVTLKKETINNREVVLAVVHDIDHRKQLEEQLQERNDELEKMNKAMVGREVRMSELKDQLKGKK
jgi:PAS domain S-box-containing protein